MKSTQNIGFLGGTFDPFHIGHLNFAIELLEKSDLEAIWICPTNLSPFKLDRPPIAYHHRLKMIQEAIEGIPNLKLTDMESKGENPAYTYETLRKLKQQGLNPTLILSDDLLYGFERWHKAKELISEFPFLVGKRELIALEEEKIAPWLFSQIKNNSLHIRYLDICSSEIRDRLKNKLCCRHLLPLKTLDYIYKCKLYS